MTANRQTGFEFFRNCYLYALFLLPFPFILLFTGAPFWGYLLWALFVAMAALVETLRNILIITTVEKNSFQFRLEQLEGVLRSKQAEAEQSKASLLSWISVLEKRAEEQRAEMQTLRRIGRNSSSHKLDACEIVTYGNDQSAGTVSGVNCAA